MNVVVPLTDLHFLKEFYYPTIMQMAGGKTTLEHSLESLNITAQYHFVLRWEDHTKYSIGNYLESAFPGATITVVKDRLHGDAEAVLKAPLNNDPLVIFDAKSKLLWNPEVFSGRILKANADAAVAVFPNLSRKFPHIQIGGYHHNAVSRISQNGFALAGLYYFSQGFHFTKSAPQIIKDELEMNYRPIGVDTVLNYLLSDGAKCLYHRVGRRDLTSLNTLNKIENGN